MATVLSRAHLSTLLCLAALQFECHEPSAIARAATSNQQGQAVDQTSDRPLKEFDRNILLELLDLAKFNVRFRLEANEHWKLRGWLYPLEQEAGTGLTFSGTLADLVERARGYDQPPRISRRVQKEGVKRNVVGESQHGCALASNILSLHAFSDRTYIYLNKLLAAKETATGKHTEVKEVATIVSDSARTDDNLSQEELRIRKLRRVAAQQAITGPLSNMGSLARQICTEVSYADYRGEPVTANCQRPIVEEVLVAIGMK